MNKLVNYLKEFRFKNCLTQQELAAKCNITHPTYIKVEQGKETSVRTLQKIANGLGVNYKYVVNLYNKEEN